MKLIIWGERPLSKFSAQDNEKHHKIRTIPCLGHHIQPSNNNNKKKTCNTLAVNEG